MRHIKWLVIALLLGTGATAQTINCPSGFSSTGSCSTTGSGTSANFQIFANGGANLSGSTIILQPTGVVHNPNSVMYQTPVNVQAFTANFRFVPNAWNLAFILENVTHNAGAGPTPGYTLASSFSGGAGCEEGFYQAFGGSGNPPANNIFVLNFDSGNLLVNSLSPFYSNVQIYQQLADPCIPADGTEPWYYRTNKVSTSPVPMNSPATTYQTTTGNTYDAAIIYTGTSFTLNMYDVTAGGTCSPVTSGTCFSYAWHGVAIPALVDGTTAYLGFGGSTNAPSPGPLRLDSLVYTVLSAAAGPSFSPAGGTYSSPQTVALSDSSGGSVICWNTTGGPATNGVGGCLDGSLYSGSISVSKGETIYAVAGGGGAAYGDSAIKSAAYDITGSASTPTFNQAGGTYQGDQTVYLSAAQGEVICYDTAGSPETDGSTGCTAGTLYSGPITVSSNETLFAVAGGTGYTDSAVGSAGYVISPFAVVDGFTGSYPANSPRLSPVPGTYSSTQSVSLSTTTPGANICYVVSPAPPTLLPEPDSLGGCSVGTLYTSAITVAPSETIYAAAGTTVGADLAGTGPPSSVVSGTYQLSSGMPPAAAPAFSPAAGNYVGMQSVTLSTTSAGAIICYNTISSQATNGSTGCTTGTLYVGPVSVSSSETLYAVAGGTGYTDSSVSSAGYVIGTSVAIPTFSPGAGTYIATFAVAISDATIGAKIYYTTDGTVPTTSSTLYTGPITVSSTETLQAIAAATGDINSAVASATYTIAPTVATPAFSPAAGTYTTAQSVTLSDGTSGVAIYYTTNGNTPTTSSTLYTGPVTVSSTEALKAIAAATGDTNSAVASAAYTITPVVATPVFSPAGGGYTTAQSVSLSDGTAGATIYYTTNGTTPTTSSTQYTGPITVSSTETLKAIAAATGDTNSPVASATYTITPVVATPIFSPAAGSYTTAQSVSLSDGTSGATIYYTTNGTTPTTSSTQYTGPITVSSTETLEAIAAATGDTNSAVAPATYTITAVATTTTLTASSTQITIGQSVTFTAKLVPQSGNVPTGSIKFFDGTESLGKASLNGSGRATLSTTALTAATHSITASYFGDNEDSSSVSNVVSVVVTQSAGATTTTLMASAALVAPGQSVTFTATVAPRSGSNVPTGTVTFLDGTTTLGEGTLNTSGVGTLTTSSLPVGTQSITASYAGDGNDDSSVSHAVSVVVSQSIVATTTTLSASATQITTGQSVTFNAKVVRQSGNGVPTGSIKFFDGTTSLGKASLNGSGTATLNTTALAAGTHSITASYFGDKEDNSSVSNSVSIVVMQSTAATTLPLPQ